MADVMPSVAEWKTATKTKSDDGFRSRIEFALRAYHVKKAGEMDERLRLMNEMLELCREYKDSCNRPKMPAPVSDPLYMACIDLGMRAEKQMAVSTKAKHAWGQARKIFGPSQGAHGPTQTLQHYGRDAAAPTSQRNYWLEGLDPKHRSWGHMDKAIFDEWLADAGTSLGFWDWLEQKKKADVPGVQYLAPDQRWKYMCIFGDDKVIYRHDESLGGRGGGSIPLKRFSTHGMWTAHSKDHFAIWVCSPGGVFYTNTHQVSRFHHSTFLSGGRVLAAGEWVVSAGKILLISHKTGHHAASPRNLYSALVLLRTRVDLSRTAVLVQDFVKNDVRFVRATQFLARNGDATKCDAIPGDLVKFARSRCAAGVDWEGQKMTSPEGFPG